MDGVQLDSKRGLAEVVKVVEVVEVIHVVWRLQTSRLWTWSLNVRGEASLRARAESIASSVAQSLCGGCVPAAKLAKIAGGGCRNSVGPR